MILISKVFHLLYEVVYMQVELDGDDSCEMLLVIWSVKCTVRKRGENTYSQVAGYMKYSLMQPMLLKP